MCDITARIRSGKRVYTEHSLRYKINLFIHNFNYQLKNTTLKNVELLKHFKISKTAPTCFGLQGNHHKGATVST